MLLIRTSGDKKATTVPPAPPSERVVTPPVSMASSSNSLSNSDAASASDQPKISGESVGTKLNNMIQNLKSKYDLEVVAPKPKEDLELGDLSEEDDEEPEEDSDEISVEEDVQFENKQL